MTETEYPLTGELSYENITGQENAAVINSIRLWDWRPLRRTFRQLQELRSQYDFPDVDIDRNTKVLDVLSRSYSNYRWQIRKPVSGWGIYLLRHLQVLMTSFPDHFPPDSCGGVEEILLLQWTSQVIESNGSLPKGGSQR